MVSTPVDVNAVFAALEKWINQRPGLDFRNYGQVAPYRAELRSIAADKKRALKALDEARALDPQKPELLADAFRAFSGRLEWHPDGEPDVMGDPQKGHLEYTAGQYWPTEYRKAAASVLETYVADWRQWYASEHPQEFTYKTLEDVIAANQGIGQHFFDRSSMRFFKCKIESGLIAGKRFITSEKGPDEVRRYTVREAKPNGAIRTVGAFQQYRTRDQARAHVLDNPEATA